MCIRFVILNVVFVFLFSWLSKQFHSEGRLSIGSTGHKNMHIGLGLGGSGLDAKGGIVGGTIELNKINTYGMFFEIFCCVFLLVMFLLFTQC